MSILTVGADQDFATVHDAVAASASGDTIQVYAGTYENDWVTVRHDLTIEGVPDTDGTLPKLVATTPPPNQMGLIDQLAGDLVVSNLDISGAHLHHGDHGRSNAAGIRFQGGSSLTLDGDYIHNNDDGILVNPVSDATIQITGSELAYNGTGDGYTHDIYVGRVASFIMQDSYVHDARGGHEVKSRAASTTLTGNVIADGNANASYAVDLPNGGAADITDNVLQQSARSPNNAIISYGEEGRLWTGGSLSVANNTILNDLTVHRPVGLRNWTSTAADINGNDLYGMNPGQLLKGAGSVSGTGALSDEPSVTALGQLLTGS